MTDQQKLIELARLIERLNEANGKAKHMRDAQDAISDFVVDARKVLTAGVVGGHHQSKAPSDVDGSGGHG